MTAPLRLGIAGLGTVGAEVVRLLAQNKTQIAARAGRPVIVTAVSARDRARDRGLHLANMAWHDNPVSLAASPDVDVVVELIGGADGVAFDLVTSALQAGKPVVTANKALLSRRAAALCALRGTVAFEAAVAGGIPAIKSLNEGLAANSIGAVYGILNGTCNFILSTMEKTGRRFDDVLREAQAKGYAEADPAFDIDGIDTAHKLSILSALAFGGLPDFESIAVTGIRHVSDMDIAAARELGFRIRLLGISRRGENGAVIQSVSPCLIPASSSLAAVDGVMNAVAVESSHAGRILLVGAGAGAAPTASAVVADIIDIARGCRLPLFPQDTGNRAPSAAADPAEGAYYLRLLVVDKPGVIADVSAILRDHGISIESVLQRGHDAGKPVSVILTTHPATPARMRAAADRIAALPAMLSAPQVMGIESSL